MTREVSGWEWWVELVGELSATVVGASIGSILEWSCRSLEEDDGSEIVA